MPEVTISIGGREFDVACQEGERPFLETAARLLDAEAQVLVGQMGRMPELRLLLMSGLMLADKTAALEDEVVDLREKIASQEAMIAELTARGGAAAAPAGPAVSEDTLALLADLADRAEALAEATTV